MRLELDTKLTHWLSLSQSILWGWGMVSWGSELVSSANKSKSTDMVAEQTCFEEGVYYGLGWQSV